MRQEWKLILFFVISMSWTATSKKFKRKQRNSLKVQQKRWWEFYYATAEWNCLIKIFFSSLDCSSKRDRNDEKWLQMPRRKNDWSHGNVGWSSLENIAVVQRNIVEENKTQQNIEKACCFVLSCCLIRSWLNCRFHAANFKQGLKKFC